MTEKELKPEELNLVTLAAQYSDEDKARGLLEQMRWPDGPICPHCKHNEVYIITPKATSKSPARKGLYCCAACRKQFTVKVGTIFEGSHIPISKWLMALFIMCSSKKSISSHQLHRMLGITYKTAWFMTHRIRYAMGGDSTKKLSGIVEVDETFVGGKGSRDTTLARKTPVVALIERDGNMRTAVVSNVTQKNLGRVLNESVSKNAIVNTDEHGAYRNPLKEFKQHNTVVHSKYEYSRKLDDGTKAGINTCESFFSLLKRGVYGSWHHVSREHLPKYAGEFEFRWNNRKVTDGERMVAAVGRIEGKRLTYRQAI
ncbi:IS1595-like element ISVer1 family transposase [Pedosphaera parvula]|uniref:ISSpo8, transposase n=1 Tax=Pedosphaera parvula (strain Ellin514) TaxID=320771 RepID=B9XEE2_PEDPL|nr:IS1595-like element ISVer1 family transposase [Pedosphaera parvula]EEF61656.1 ISSpo8, transposase [Pedosphaera parvula Ellin514]